MSVDAGQMFVKKAEVQKVEVKVGHGGESNRTVASGHQAEKFGIADDHDFAAARAKLKSASSSAPKADEKKLAEARARTGHEVGVVKTSNQVHLKK